MRIFPPDSQALILQHLSAAPPAPIGCKPAPWLYWIQAGPHASGCDEPGQVGRSSPKSFPRVPWSARPLCAQKAPQARAGRASVRRAQSRGPERSERSAGSRRPSALAQEPPREFAGCPEDARAFGGRKNQGPERSERSDGSNRAVRFSNGKPHRRNRDTLGGRKAKDRERSDEVRWQQRAMRSPCGLQGRRSSDASPKPRMPCREHSDAAPLLTPSRPCTRPPADRAGTPAAPARRGSPP